MQIEQVKALEIRTESRTEAIPEELKLKTCRQTHILMLLSQFAKHTNSNSQTLSRMKSKRAGRSVKPGGGRYRMTDNTRMTAGIYKGTRMKDIPAAYLLHLPKDVVSARLKKYVVENQAVLKLEARRDGRLQYNKSMVKR
jgi:hypothetical protein